jgi:hypothetical protein
VFFLATSVATALVATVTGAALRVMHVSESSWHSDMPLFLCVFAGSVVFVYLTLWGGLLLGRRLFDRSDS